jgi:hypothetical protein
MARITHRLQIVKKNPEEFNRKVEEGRVEKGPAGMGPPEMPVQHGGVFYLEGRMSSIIMGASLALV